MERISEDSRAFVETWEDVGELLDAATQDERLQILRHYIEVVELGSNDPKGLTGTYVLRLFPEVRPDRGFDWGDEGRDIVPDDGSPCSETTNGAEAVDGCDPALLTDGDVVRTTVQKAPRLGVESLQDSPANTANSVESGTDSGTVGARDDGLERLIVAWPELSERAKRTIVDAVEADER